MKFKAVIYFLGIVILVWGNFYLDQSSFLGTDFSEGFNFFDIENVVDPEIEREKYYRDADKVKSRVTKFGLTLKVDYDNEIWIIANGADFAFLPDIVDKITADRLFSTPYCTCVRFAPK